MSEEKKIEEVEADMNAAAEAVEKSEEDGKPILKDLVSEAETDEKKKKLSMEKSFSFEWTDGEGTLLHGQFTCKRFTIRDMGAVGVAKARMNEGQVNVDLFTDRLHEMLSFCRYALTDVPKWWTPEDFLDTDPLHSVYQYILDWHASFR